MVDSPGNRPAEIFGYPLSSRSRAAVTARRNHTCPFMGQECEKKSRLLTIPFGVCSVEYGGSVRAICPRRFEERRTAADAAVPLALENIARHYFGSIDNIVIFPEVKLPGIGNIDYVIIRHKPMSHEVDDFVAVEFQSDSTTGTGELVRGMRDFMHGRDMASETYRFGINTYDSIKRAMTQLINKGIVYENWNAKCYWVIQEYIYENLVNRYGLRQDGYDAAHTTRFALYDIVPRRGRLSLTATRYISSSVAEIYQAMRNNPGMPGKDAFVANLNRKLRLQLNVR